MSQLPYRANSAIASGKMEWLLVNGKHAGQWADVGITIEDTAWLEQVCYDIARNADYVEKTDNGHATLYRFYELAYTPKGKRLPVFCVWALKPDSHIPHLVTAYPRSRPYQGKTI